MHYDITTVGFYEAMALPAIDFVLNQTQISTIFCDGAKVARVIDMREKGFGKTIRNVVHYDAIDAETQTKATNAGLTLFAYQDILSQGKSADAKEHPFRESKPEDVYILCYTSGTTGDSKGVKISNWKMMASVFNLAKQSPTTADDCHISYMPYPHAYEQCMTCHALYCGSSVGYYQGNPLKLLEDCAVLQPTSFASVPRLYKKIYHSIREKFEEATGCKRWLINSAVASKQASAENAIYTSGCYDALIFNKIKAILGGKVRFMISASAPIDVEVLNFLKICFCCQIREGYGLTEVSGGVTATSLADPLSGHVGGPAEAVRLRIRDVPEMNYFSSDKPYPRGELCIKGPSVFSGYFMRPDKTSEAFDKEGWFLSGDVV